MPSPAVPRTTPARLVLAFIFSAVAAPVVRAADGAVDFQAHVLPILQKNCLPCHRGAEPDGDLNMESREGMLKGGESGPAIVPGNAADSRLFLSASQKQKPAMPPKKNKVGAVALTADQLDVLKRWIDAGAKGSAKITLEPPKWAAVPANWNTIYAAAINSDGRYAVAGRGNRLFVYDVAARQLLAELSDPKLAHAAHRDAVQSVAMSGDGLRIAAGSYRSVKIWRGVLERTEQHVDAPAAPAVNAKQDVKIASPDGSRTLVLRNSGVAKWQAKDGKQLDLPLDRPLAREKMLAPLRVEYATAERKEREEALKKLDDTIKAETEAADKAKKLLAGVKEQPAKPDEKPAKSGDKEKKKKKADEAAEITPEMAKRRLESATAALERAKQARSAAEAEAKAAESSEKQAKEAAKALEARAKQTPLATAGAFSSDGKLIVIGDANGGLHVFSADDAHYIGALPAVGGRVEEIKADADSVLVRTGQTVVKQALKPRWTLERTVEPVTADAAPSDRVLALAFSPDGRLLAMAGGIPSRDGEVVVVDVETGAVAKKIDCGHRDTVNAIAFSPDGKLLASGSSDRQVRVFEVASGKLVQTLEGHTSYVQGVSWHRNGRVLASAGAEKTVKLWNLQTGEQIRTIDTFDRPVTSLAYLGYRAKLIVGTTAGLSEFIRDDGGAPVVLTESGPAVNVVAASEDGLYVVTGDQSGVLRVWDVTTGKPAAAFEPTRQK